MSGLAKRAGLAGSLMLMISVSGGCVGVERPPRTWPAPEPDTPAELVELVRQCRSAAIRRGARANHALRGEAALVVFSGASLAGGAVSTSLAGLDQREREGMIGAAVVTTISAGVALGGRLVEPGERARGRYEATRRHELAAREGLGLLVELDARLARGEGDREGLLRRRAELRELVLRELSRCVGDGRG